MEKQIDEIIKKAETSEYSKYLMTCSISDFKQLQKLMRDKYKIKDYHGGNSMWVHDTDAQMTYGTVRFNNFEINVMRLADYFGEFKLKQVDEVDKIFKNSRNGIATS